MIEYVLPLVIFTSSAVAVVMVTDVPARLAEFAAIGASGTQNGSELSVDAFGRLPVGTDINMEKYTLASAEADTAPVDGGADDAVYDGTGTIAITLSNGQTIEMADYPEMADMVETAGANGTTTKLLAHLDTLVTQLEDAGEIDKEQANLLKELSNRGHRIAQIEALVEGAMADSKTVDDFKRTTLMFEGKEYTPRELGDLIRWQRPVTRYSVQPYRRKGPLDERGAKTELRGFLRPYHDAERAGALDNPAVREVVTHLATQISEGATMVGDLTREVNSSDVSLTDAGKKKVYRATRFQSAGICRQGGGRDHGFRCR